MSYPTLNFGLGETIDMLRDAVHHFAQAELARARAQIDRDNEFPMDMWRKFGDMGLLGMTVEEEYGGTNMGYPAHVVAMEEISRASASVGLSYGAHSNPCVNQIRKNGTHEQKLKRPSKLCSGEHVGALAMSEPNAGSDVVSMKLRAEKRGDRYLLNGNKMWITNGPDANTYVIYAKTDINAGSRGMTAFIVERDFKGFSRHQKLDKLGMRGPTPASWCSKTAGAGRKHLVAKAAVRVLMSGLTTSAHRASGGPTGIMSACMDVVLPHVHERCSSWAVHRRIPAGAGQAGRHVRRHERLQVLPVQRRQGLRPRRGIAQDAAAVIPTPPKWPPRWP